MRQFERYYSGLGRFPASAYASPVEVFYTRLSHTTKHNNANIISCSTNILNRYITKYPNNPAFIDSVFHSRNAHLQSLSATHMKELEPLFPNVVKYDELLYAYSEVADLEQNKHDLSLHLVVDTLTQNSLNMLVSYYRILSLLTLYTIKTKK